MFRMLSAGLILLKVVPQSFCICHGDNNISTYILQLRTYRLLTSPTAQSICHVRPVFHPPLDNCVVRIDTGECKVQVDERFHERHF